ncbi:hypothetical protein KP509_15G040600 [Ceratopteris richardii]|uniref:Uncharacterized protein n=1 Tax=Ceratopteris richardii TaxID=49495 RepID=A0A8T2T7F8_CERRI|nr:hypothetical protein KP509_15G040600 [Ceratopteris richardii]
MEWETERETDIYVEDRHDQRETKRERERKWIMAPFSAEELYSASAKNIRLYGMGIHITSSQCTNMIYTPRGSSWCIYSPG